MKTNHTKDEQNPDHETLEKSLDKLYNTDGIPPHLKQPLSFLRQWLNEDRKCSPQVTTQELWHWLKDSGDTKDEQSEVRGVIKKWKINAEYLVKKIKQDNYKDIERHFVDFTESALTQYHQDLMREVEEVIKKTHSLPHGDKSLDYSLGFQDACSYLWVKMKNIIIKSK